MSDAHAGWPRYVSDSERPVSEVLVLRVLQMLQQMYLLGRWELVRQGWLHARSQTGPHPQSLPRLCGLACKPGGLIIISFCSLGVP